VKVSDAGSGTKRSERAKLSRAQLRLRGMSRLKGSRRIVQLVFATWIIVAAVRHGLPSAEEGASVDALCPFDALETLITWITTGHFISKIHQSNLILGLAVLVATVLVGNVFCGWICPFGAPPAVPLRVRPRGRRTSRRAAPS
jgi:4Fe-4S binding domain